VAVVAAGAEDDTVIEITMREGRVFLTEDRDFGQLVYAVAKPTQGAILRRTRAPIS
jgi:predicted nuclease of predicted toxin-antitoxin system